MVSIAMCVNICYYLRAPLNCPLELIGIRTRLEEKCATGQYFTTAACEPCLIQTDNCYFC